VQRIYFVKNHTNWGLWPFALAECLKGMPFQRENCHFEGATDRRRSILTKMIMYIFV
jgi:hypothetical protein